MRVTPIRNTSKFIRVSGFRGLGFKGLGMLGY